MSADFNSILNAALLLAACSRGSDVQDVEFQQMACGESRDIAYASRGQTFYFAVDCTSGAVALAALARSAHRSMLLTLSTSPDFKPAIQPLQSWFDDDTVISAATVPDAGIIYASLLESSATCDSQCKDETVSFDVTNIGPPISDGDTIEIHPEEKGWYAASVPITLTAPAEPRTFNLALSSGVSSLSIVSYGPRTDVSERTDANRDFNYSIFNPNVSTVEPILFSYDPNFTSPLMFFQPQGVLYEASVSITTADSGTLDVAFIDAPIHRTPHTPSVFEAEPNEVPATAVDISADEALGYGTISADDDVDTWHFSCPKDCWFVVYFYDWLSGSTLKADYSVFGSDGTLVGTVNSHPGDDGRTTVGGDATLPDYYVDIRPVVGSRTGEGTFYELSVHCAINPTE